MDEEKVDLLFEGPDPMLVMEFTNPETGQAAMYPFAKGQVTKGVLRWAADQCLAMNPNGIEVGNDAAAVHYAARFFRIANGGEG